MEATKVLQNAKSESNSTLAVQGAASALRPAFSQILPNLQLLKTGYPDDSEARNTSDFYYAKDTLGTTHTFIAKNVSSDDIKNKLNDFMVKDDKGWIDAYPKTLKKIIIYCDSLLLNENIWLPQCDFEIHARAINLQHFNINASGLSSRASEFSAVDINSTIGEDATDSGNITVTTAAVNGSGKFIANGGKGAAVFVPEVTIGWPTHFRTHVEVYMGEGCDADYNKNASHGFDLAASPPAIGASKYSYFKDETPHPKSDYGLCASYDSFGNPSEVNVSYTAGRKPGKGGKNGNITVNIEQGSIGHENNKSQKGVFIARDKGTDVNYGTVRQIFKEISVTQRVYRTHKLTIYFDPGFFWGWNAHRPSQTSSDATYPHADKIDKFNADMAALLPADVADGTFINKSIKYLPHREYLLKQFEYFETHYFAYYKKSKEDKQQLDKAAEDFAEAIKNYSAKVNDKDPLKQDWSTWYSKAVDLTNYKNRNIDEFGNVPGYYPTLSLKQTMEYMQANLQVDMSLFVTADILANDETQVGDFLKQVGNIIADLRSKNDKFFNDIVEANVVFDKLQPQVTACQIATDAINDKVLKLETRLLAEAKADSKAEHFWKTTAKLALKTVAVASYAIPIGQPMVGQISSSILNTIADGLDDSLNGIVQKTISNVDMSGAMKALAQKQVKTLAPDKKAYYTLLSEEDKYKVDKAKYDDEVKALNDKYTSLISIGKDALKSFADNSADAKDLEERVRKLEAISPEFAELSNDLKKQNVLKQDIYAKVADTLQRIGNLQSNILQNATAIFKLQQKEQQSVYSEELDDAMHAIRSSALNRTKWIEYELIKAFEYTTVTPCSQTMAASTILKYYIDRAKGSKIADVDSIVKQLTLAFDNQRHEMGKQILQDPDISRHRTDKDTGRKIVFNAPMINPYLAQLNEEGCFTLDLQQDFIEQIIRPDESHALIKEVKLEKLEFEGDVSDNPSFKVKLEIMDEGIIRKNKDFFVFKTGKNKGVADILTWNINIEDGICHISDTEHSEEWVNFLTTGNEGDDTKLSNFAAMPAWTRWKISISKTTAGEMPKVSVLQLGLQCGNLELELDNGETVLDVKTENVPSSGLLFTSKVNGEDEKSHTCNYYTVVQTDTTVLLAINTNDTHVSDNFVQWEIIKGNKSQILTDKSISVALDKNTRVRVVFKDANAPSLLSQNSEAIKLYKALDTDAPILRIVYNLDDCALIEDNKVAGFKRVSYKGIQEAFIKL